MLASKTKRMNILKVPKSMGALETGEDRGRGMTPKQSMFIISLMKCAPLIKVLVTAAIASGTKVSHPVDQ